MSDFLFADEWHNYLKKIVAFSVFISNTVAKFVYIADIYIEIKK